MVMYYKERDVNNQLREDVIKKIDGDIISYVPCDLQNMDYKAYLEWEEIEGNDIIITPEEPLPE